ncbi:hypothetical protein MML48_9g00008709 [Holotrichia oblita]|uniref:Uncharacterized protein n=1 Tax=Holotrichia oblita TaxID=644536 RepID=A0ACB9SKP2_HOLOL|nr:hypothetical protein MML48_9g00008709 [Holotrichia oblita]
MLSKDLSLFLSYAYSMFFDDDDDDENITITKIYGFAESVVHRMVGDEFKSHFRLTSTKFEGLLTKLHATKDTSGHVEKGGTPKMPLEKEMLITIWYLVNIESFRSVANRFGISKSTCWDVLYRTCKLVLAMNNKYKVLWWPNRQRSVQIIEAFKRKGMPGVIGAIDGCHMRLVAPVKHHVSYINRKGYHSVLLQAVCDNRLPFTYVYAGQPGSLHYAVFCKSDLFRRIETRDITFWDNSHIIGDLAYALHDYLLVGFKNTGYLTLQQKNFNVILNKSRVTILLLY